MYERALRNTHNSRSALLGVGWPPHQNRNAPQPHSLGSEASRKTATFISAPINLTKLLPQMKAEKFLQKLSKRNAHFQRLA